MDGRNLNEKVKLSQTEQIIQQHNVNKFSFNTDLNLSNPVNKVQLDVYVRHPSVDGLGIKF